MSTQDIPLGARVSVNAGVGRVRWAGVNPKFSTGHWVGIELDTPSGKNNGSVQGDSYFSCEPNYGVFVRRSQVTVLEQPTPARTARGSALPKVGVGASRPSTAVSRSATPASKPPVARAAPAPGTPSRAASRASVAGQTTPPRAGVAPSTGPSGTVRAAARVPRPSVAGGMRPASVVTGRRQSTVPTPMVSPSPSSASMRAPSVSSRRTSTISLASNTSNNDAGPTSVAEADPDALAMPPPPVPIPPSPRPRMQAPPSPSPQKLPVSPSPQRSSLPERGIPPPKSPIAPRSAVALRVPTPLSDIEGSVSRSADTATISASPRTARTALSTRSGSPDREMAALLSSQKRELEETKIKLRLLETRRAEDQERIKTLEKKASEGDQLAAIRAKLQAKFQEQAAALVNAQRLARDLQSENAHLETRAAEAIDQLEMATLDREVAEEKAEASEAEVARLNEKIQELELEVALVKEENAEYERPIDGLEGERGSIAYVQLEKHNERLKEALIRLRDVAGETEREQRGKIADLEKELSRQEDVASHLELAEAKLRSSEEQVEDLKQQLDDALGAEDLLEELTERNLQMGERIEEMRTVIEDLEALKELNDELEENHVATEQQLEEEIDAMTSKLRDELARSADLEAVIVDMEATISQFRELVANLHSEIDALRLQQESQVHETATASKESQALLNLNLKLQSSAAKTQSKTIDLELKKIEAAQLTEHLAIVQAYLPEAYTESEVDSVTTLLFFYRVADKVDMLTSVISNVHGLPAALHSAASDALVGVCELRGKMRHFSTLNRRFAAVMRRSSSEDFGNLGKVVGELVGVESKIDGWISLIKADEFSEGDCARELDSLIAQFNHLAEIMFDRPELDAGEQQLALAYSLEDDLDNFAAAVGFVRHAVQSVVKEGDVDVDVAESSLDESVYDPVQRILNQVRAVKAPTGKLVAVLEDAVAHESALLPEFSTALSNLVQSVSHAVDMAVQLAQRVGMHTINLRSSKEPLRLRDIDRFLAEVTDQTDAPWDVISSFVTRLGVELGDALPKFRNAPKANQVVSLAVPPPWLERVASIKEAASYNAEAERKVSRLTEELKDSVRLVKLRDQTLEEKEVKIDTLERRLEGSRKQADMILELETEISKLKKAEETYEEQIEALQADADALEAENARLKKRRGVVGEDDAVVPKVATGGELATIESLKAAIRFLRSENSLLRSRDLYADVQMLPSLRRRVPPVPALVYEDDSGAESDGPVTPPRSSAFVLPTRQGLQTESKLLLRELTKSVSKGAIVDITGLEVGGSAWAARKKNPEMQVWRMKLERRKLEDKVEDLARRVNALRR